MEYEKNKTLAILKQMVADGKITQADAEKYCPEIVENEDEMMIKFIKEQLLNIKKTITENYELDAKLTKAIDWLEKQGEQKPAIIIPKFHEGEWITNNDYTWKIIEVKPLDYILQSQGGYIVDDTISHVDEQFHSFTIQDAKDGDVLYAKGSYFKEYLFMFSSFTEDNVISTHFGYDVFHGTFDTKLSRFGRKEDFVSIIPATKEQRNLLFQKMHDAGYEWDAEKKELKKIEQKPAWSEEDERIYQSIMDDTVQENQLNDKQIDWLRDIKCRHSSQPQSTWKPSDEQMKALDEARSLANNCGEEIAFDLRTLYQQLKKLRED